MKKLLYSIVLYINFFTSFVLLSQSRAGIYNIHFNIDRKLTHPTQVTVNGNIVQNDEINATRFLDSDIDSIKKIIERTVSTELHAISECIYRKNRNGKDVKTNDFGSTLRGMPYSSKRTAIKLHEKEYYVSVSINYNAIQRTSLGAAMIGIKQYKPVVKIRIIAYNEQRKLVYRKRIFVNDFEKLKGFESNINGVQIQNFQILSSLQIREMLDKSLRQLIEKGK